MTDTVPWVKWRFDKWRGDEGLRMCGLASRGLWADLLAIMHGCEPYGHLSVKGRSPSPKQIASMVGMTTEREVVSLLQELEDNGVFSRSDDGLIFCRRLTRDNAARILGKATGGKGGNPNLIGGSQNEDNGVRKLPPLDGGLTPPVNPEKREDTREEKQEKESSSLRSGTAPETPKPKRSLRRTQTHIHLDWQPDEAGVVYATDRGIRMDQEIPSFRNHHQAKASLMADWSAAWRTWCDNQVKWGHAPGKLSDTAAPGLFGLRRPVNPDDPGGVYEWCLANGAEPAAAGDAPYTKFIVSGEMFDKTATDILLITGMPFDVRHDWNLLRDWIKAGISGETIYQTIKRVVASLRSRGDYTPPGSLKFFDKSVSSATAGRHAA